MNPVIRVALIALLAASSLAGCAAGSANRPRSAYEKACRSPFMTQAAAREAFWCWHSVGAHSYDQWIAYERSVAAEGEAQFTGKLAATSTTDTVR
jgi:hypothetical protein